MSLLRSGDRKETGSAYRKFNQENVGRMQGPGREDETEWPENRKCEHIERRLVAEERVLDPIRGNYSISETPVTTGCTLTPQLWKWRIERGTLAWHSTRESVNDFHSGTSLRRTALILANVLERIEMRTAQHQYAKLCSALF